MTDLLIRLSNEERAFFTQAQLPPDLLASITWRTSNEFSISSELAECVREELTVELACCGLDSNYQLTPAGAVIEAIIDKLHRAMSA